MNCIDGHENPADAVVCGMCGLHLGPAFSAPVSHTPAMNHLQIREWRAEGDRLLARACKEGGVNAPRVRSLVASAQKITSSGRKGSSDIEKHLAILRADIKAMSDADANGPWYFFLTFMTVGLALIFIIPGVAIARSGRRKRFESHFVEFSRVLQIIESSPA